MLQKAISLELKELDTSSLWHFEARSLSFKMHWRQYLWRVLYEPFLQSFESKILLYLGLR